MERLEDYLILHAGQHPDKPAVLTATECVSYGQLCERAQQRAAQLSGQTQERCIVFRASQTADFLVDYFAIHLAGRVAVPLEHDVPEARMQEIISLTRQSDIPQGVADILFTTGTTGRSKGVMIGHHTILANAENLAEAQGFSADLTFIISGPLNHIGSLSKIYPTILQGGTLYVTPGMKDSNAFFEALDYPAPRMGTFLVPASIRILLQFSRQRLASYAHKIELIETGAAPITQSDMEQLCEVLPHTRLFNTYASTETGIISTYNFNDGQCVAGCLGRPMRHSNFHITPDGLVACTGKTLMMGYVGDPQLTSKILYDGVLHTSDHGTIDSLGQLHLQGRSDDVINTGGFKVNPVEVEDVAMALPEVIDCVCIPVPHVVLGKALKLLVVLAEGHALDKKRIALHISQHLERHKVPVAYEQTDKVNRTYNGKLDRKSYLL